MQKLFNELMAVTERDKTKFFFKDFKSALDTDFRVFSYHLASYTDWLEPSALECRGIMFEMDGDKPVRIASRPMEKFFNLNECPFTIGLDLTKVVLAMAKEDGSLISSYIDKGRLGMKSKTSVYSQQAAEALQWISAPSNDAFKERVTELAKNGFTCNFEYVAPTNRIVLDYQDRNLILLNVRENDTGEYVPYTELFKDGVLRPYLVRGYDFDTSNEDFIEEIRAQEGIEGFIFELESGQKFKLKTKWYSALHHTKDSINNNQRLFEVIIAGGSDDIKAMFFGDDYAIRKIETFEDIYRDYLTESLAELESLYAVIAGKDRKDYAVTAQTVLKSKPGLFGIIMMAFGNGIDYDKVVERISSVFMKEHKTLVPAEYSTIKVVEE